MPTRTCLVTLAAVAIGIVSVAGAQPRPAPARPAPAAGGEAPKAPATRPPGGGAAARGQQSSSPIVIDADRMEAMKKEGLVIFTGNVVAKQDNSVQSADRMEVYLDDKGERVLRIVSTGNVKIVTEDCRTGTARRAEYYDDEQRLLLVGDAKVWQDENVVTGDQITIWLAEDRSLVDSGGQGRVKSVFYPKREEDKAADPKPAATAAKDGKRPASCG